MECDLRANTNDARREGGQQFKEKRRNIMPDGRRVNDRLELGNTKERSFFTSSFFKGVLVGLAVTVAVVAVVATGGAALAVC